MVLFQRGTFKNLREKMKDIAMESLSCVELKPTCSPLVLEAFMNESEISTDKSTFMTDIWKKTQSSPSLPYSYIIQTLRKKKRHMKLKY